MAEIFKWILDHWSFCAFLLAIFIQITPALRLNPLTALFHWIGNIITAETRRDIAELKAIANRQQAAIDENEKDRIRWEVLSFSNACRSHVMHTRDEFVHIIALHDKYLELLQRTGDTNGVFDAEYALIERMYRDQWG